MNSTNDNLFVVVAIVLTFAVGMATFLNYYKFNSLVGRLMQSRVIVIANEIQDNVEKGLALGLSLQENNTLQGLIERELRADELLKTITLFDATGTVLYSTESVQQGQKVDKTWLKTSIKASSDSWLVSERNSLVTGVPLKNNFGVTLGHVAIGYTKKPLEHCMGIIGNTLLQTALVVLMVFAAVTFYLLVLAFRRYRKELLNAESELTHLIKTLDGVTSKKEAEQFDAPSVFIQQVRSFTASVSSTAAEIDLASTVLKSRYP
jgi:sensor histidine kinase regulating citrate/malate metabolism